jgi:hypothetical protein
MRDVCVCAYCLLPISSIISALPNPVTELPPHASLLSGERRTGHNSSLRLIMPPGEASECSIDGLNITITGTMAS